MSVKKIFGQRGREIYGKQEESPEGKRATKESTCRAERERKADARCSVCEGSSPWKRGHKKKRGRKGKRKVGNNCQETARSRRYIQEGVI